MWQSVLALVALHVGAVHSWDFAVGVGDQLIFYTTDGTKTDTVHFESQNLAALAYDELHNMILYVDKQNYNDAIYGYNLSSLKYKLLVARNGRNIQGLAYDPATEKLFFTDTKEKSINWVSLKPGYMNNVHGNLLLKMDEGIPTDIAIDSCKGYVYWITTNLTEPAIERARFDGSEREVVINPTSLSVNATYTAEPHSLRIDPQTHKMFWVEPAESASLYKTYRADLNGKNKNRNSFFHLYFDEFTQKSSVLTITKNSLISWKWHANCPIFEEPKINNGDQYTNLFSMETRIPISIVANYKIEDQTQGLEDCEALTRLVRGNLMINHKIATEDEGPICLHGMEINGTARCKCDPGYIGEACDVPVCENYCLHGDCFNDEGRPGCSCKAGYTGDRCEVSACQGYCLNDGNCTLNDNSEPVCQCKADYVGDRCEISRCLDYCIQGYCSLSDDGQPTCSCSAGYTGERCEVSLCHGYCLNDGDCTVNEEDAPVCQCVGNYEGSRCEVDKNKTCTFNTTSHYSVQKNLTLADLLTNWRKPTAKISVTVEV